MHRRVGSGSRTCMSTVFSSRAIPCQTSQTESSQNWPASCRADAQVYSFGVSHVETREIERSVRGPCHRENNTRQRPSAATDPAEHCRVSAQVSTTGRMLPMQRLREELALFWSSSGGSGYEMAVAFARSAMTPSRAPAIIMRAQTGEGAGIHTSGGEGGDLWSLLAHPAALHRSLRPAVRRGTARNCRAAAAGNTHAGARPRDAVRRYPTGSHWQQR
jgi:hypothetical protein